MNLHSKTVPAAEISAQRGTIVMDTGALRHFTAIIPPECIVDKAAFANGPARFLEIPTLLGQNSFDIVVPERVSYEAACLLHDGKNTNDFFSSVQTPERIAITKFTKRGMRAGWLSIPPPDISDQSEAAKMMRNLYAVSISKKNNSGKRDAILRYDAIKGSEDFSYIAAMNHIVALPGTGRPIFYISDARRNLSAASDKKTETGNESLHPISSVAFLETLYDEGLLEKMGIECATFQPLRSAILQYLNNRVGENESVYSSIDTILESQDALCDAIEGVNLELNPYEAAKLASGEHAGSPRTTGLDKFNAKFAGIVKSAPRL